MPSSTNCQESLCTLTPSRYLTTYLVAVHCKEILSSSTAQLGNCGMRNPSFDGDGEHIYPGFRYATNNLDIIQSADGTFNSCGTNEDSHALLAEGLHQRTILKFADELRDYPALYKPSVENLALGGAAAWQE